MPSAGSQCSSQDASESPTAGLERSPQEIAALEEENRRLKEVVSAKQGKETTKCGYLFKYRPYKMGMFSNTWELRFFSLSGSVLQYFKTERDTAYHPRGLVNVEDCIVEVEGRKRERYWTFSVVDQSGLSLMRISTESEREAEGWIQALVRAGCTKRVLNTAFRVRSPLRSLDVRWKGENSRGLKRTPSYGAQLNRRWESGSDDTASTQLDATNNHVDRTLADRDLIRRHRQRDYNSDSGVSEVGHSSGTMPRSMTKRRGDMRASSELYTESRPSMLSADRIAVTQHSGTLNLMTIILLATNARLILENLLKYGVLTNPAHWIFFLVPDGNLPLFMCWPALALFCLFALGIEKLGVQRLEMERKASLAKKKKEVRPSNARRKAARMGRRTEAILGVLNTTNTTAALVLPSAVVHLTAAEPVPSFVIVIFTIVLWMKLVSYAHCNMDFRGLKRAQELRIGADRHDNDQHQEHREPHIPETIPQGQQVVAAVKLRYPDNIRLDNLAYFLVAPTLVYQTSYPTSSRFRARWVLGYLVRLLVGLGVLLLIVEQYMQPTIENSILPLTELKWARIFERVLKLSVPTLYGWIIIFYSLFHVWLNILAEVTRFGDREFYKDWWNATTIGDYWRLWNVPVHKWLLRHVYYPAIRHGVPKTVAACCVFFVSAVFHEMLVGLPLHMVRFWAFVGLMFQVPLLFLTEYIKKKAKSDQIGNFVFWITFCIFGQPMAIMLYYHDWVLLNRPERVAALKAGNVTEPQGLIIF